MSIRIEDHTIDLTPLENLTELEELSIHIWPWNNPNLPWATGILRLVLDKEKIGEKDKI
ncbi:MAG: hypothetical protein K2O97_08635 [Acetatifactor sp.]|nr:hypothetical protein [Acetatifactor sp.]